MTASQLVHARRWAGEIPELHNGDRLTQPEFHRRYSVMPKGVKAELIGGIVYMASPLSDDHSAYHLDLGTALNIYRAFTPGLFAGDNATTILGDESEPQPDLHLRLAPDAGGRAQRNAKGYIVGPPEFVAEVAHSTEAIDLGAKKLDYLRNGIAEYLVFCTRGGTIHWFHFPSRKQMRADKQGVWRSKVFPGLWIDGPALAGRDTVKLMTTVQAGLASPEHAAFVAELARRRSRK